MCKIRMQYVGQPRKILSPPPPIILCQTPIPRKHDLPQYRKWGGLFLLCTLGSLPWKHFMNLIVVSRNLHFPRIQKINLVRKIYASVTFFLPETHFFPSGEHLFRN